MSEHLNKDILEVIFSCLRIYDLGRSARVCKLWYQVFQTQIAKIVKSISIIPQMSLTDSIPVTLPMPTKHIFNVSGFYMWMQLGINSDSIQLYVSDDTYDIKELRTSVANSIDYWGYMPSGNLINTYLTKHTGQTHPHLNDYRKYMFDMNVFAHVNYMKFTIDKITFHWQKNEIFATKQVKTSGAKQGIPEWCSYEWFDEIVIVPHDEIAEYYIMYIVPFLHHHTGLVNHFNIKK